MNNEYKKDNKGYCYMQISQSNEPVTLVGHSL